MDKLIKLSISGRDICAPAGCSIIEAMWHAGVTAVKGVGCLSGACGSCRVMVKNAGDEGVSFELACKTTIEEGMQAVFLPPPAMSTKQYALESLTSLDEAQQQFHQTFPESSSCRHCGGCNVACPVEIDVEQGVKLAENGDLQGAADIFFNCINCDLCNTSCPESIEPNYVGLYARRLVGKLFDIPENLKLRLDDIAQGRMKL